MQMSFLQHVLWGFIQSSTKELVYLVFNTSLQIKPTFHHLMAVLSKSMFFNISVSCLSYQYFSIHSVPGTEDWVVSFIISEDKLSTIPELCHTPVLPSVPPPARLLEHRHMHFGIAPFNVSIVQPANPAFVRYVLSGFIILKRLRPSFY